jgi:hypothetical protein
LKIGSWEDGKKEEKGSSEVRKLGRRFLENQEISKLTNLQLTN